MKNSLNAHILVRVRSKEGKTVSTYKQIIEEYGRAMFPKIGKGIGVDFINELNNQIAEGTPTNLFIAVHEGWDVPLRIHQCELINVHSNIEAGHETLIPKDLHRSIASISTWFEIQTLVRKPQEYVDKIYVLSSGREIKEAYRGTTSIFKVGVKANGDLHDSGGSQK
jgi:hypothetical protein